MAYLEFLRTRKRVVILAIVLAGIALIIIAASSGHARVEVNGSQKSLRSVTGSIPLSLFLGIGGFVASIMGAWLASLNSLRETLPSVWTKPSSRERTALAIFGVDSLVLVASYILGVAAGLLVLAPLGVLGNVVVDPLAPAMLVLGLGVALMTYGNAQALTSWHLGSGGMIAGILWGSYLVLLILSISPLPPALHGIVSTLDIFNPYAYFGTIEMKGAEVTNSAMFGYGIWVRSAIVFALGAAGLAIATFGWKRMEI